MLPSCMSFWLCIWICWGMSTCVCVCKATGTEAHPKIPEWGNPPPPCRGSCCAPWHLGKQHSASTWMKLQGKSEKWSLFGLLSSVWLWSELTFPTQPNLAYSLLWPRLVSQSITKYCATMPLCAVNNVQQWLSTLLMRRLQLQQTQTTMAFLKWWNLFVFVPVGQGSSAVAKLWCDKVSNQFPLTTQNLILTRHHLPSCV